MALLLWRVVPQMTVSFRVSWAVVVRLLRPLRWADAAEFSLLLFFCPPRILPLFSFVRFVFYFSPVGSSLSADFVSRIESSSFARCGPLQMNEWDLGRQD